jgi:hypothetical protein
MLALLRDRVGAVTCLVIAVLGAAAGFVGPVGAWLIMGTGPAGAWLIMGTGLAAVCLGYAALTALTALVAAPGRGAQPSSDHAAPDPPPRPS